MSDTPRTDTEEAKQTHDYDQSREAGWPPFPADFDFARRLERALSIARQHVGVEFGFDNWRVEQIDEAAQEPYPCPDCGRKLDEHGDCYHRD